eukprot:2458907-Pyramimonas_sp.AAC.1
MSLSGTPGGCFALPSLSSHGAGSYRCACRSGERTVTAVAECGEASASKRCPPSARSFRRCSTPRLFRTTGGKASTRTSST